MTTLIIINKNTYIINAPFPNFFVVQAPFWTLAEWQRSHHKMNRPSRWVLRSREALGLRESRPIPVEDSKRNFSTWNPWNPVCHMSDVSEYVRTTIDNPLAHWRPIIASIYQNHHWPPIASWRTIMTSCFQAYSDTVSQLARLVDLDHVPPKLLAKPGPCKRTSQELLTARSLSLC